MGLSPTWNWCPVTPVVKLSVRKLCTTAYPNHPKGCPNHGKKDGCPPAAPILCETLDFDKEIWAVYNQFPFGEHVDRMRKKHPDWSDRQLACCLYWQGTARKQLKEAIRRFLEKCGPDGLLGDPVVVTCPEAQGVNVTETMRRAGITLEWPPRRFAYQVALVGERRQ